MVLDSREPDQAWVRYVPTMRERIHVYVENGDLHTDHFFQIWGLRYLQRRTEPPILPRNGHPEAPTS